MADDDEFKVIGEAELIITETPAKEEKASDYDPVLEKYLGTSPSKGLSDVEAASRVLKFGRNEIPESKNNPWLKFLGYFMGPSSYLLELAALISLILAVTQDEDDWIDFGVLVFILIGNACIGFLEEAKAENALDALKNTLAQSTRTWRNGKLVTVEAALLGNIYVSNH
jgi:H+-transporting ATPase